MRGLRLALLLATFVIAHVGVSCSSAPLIPLAFQSDASASRFSGAMAAAFQTPVLDINFPDPAVIEANGVFYAYATNSQGSNIPAARSEDLIEWSLLADAMPRLAPWVHPRPNMVWAPEVIEIGGRFLMYYVAHDRTLLRQCIGVASSSTPEGPFRDDSDRALICPPGFQRAIDPHPYSGGDALYLYFSGVYRDQPNGIYAQKLSPDGLSAVGAPGLLFQVDAPWEGSIVEAPTMVELDGRRYLFYSANDYRNETYAVGYAVCETLVGPCWKAEENPVLATGSTGSPAIGPGHQSIIEVDSEYWLLFHGWKAAVGYRNGGSRVMWLQPMDWQSGKPVFLKQARR